MRTQSFRVAVGLAIFHSSVKKLVRHCEGFYCLNVFILINASFGINILKTKYLAVNKNVKCIK